MRNNVLWAWSCFCGYAGTGVPNDEIRNPNVEIPGPDLAFKECGPELELRNTAATTLWPSDVAPGQAETNSNLEFSNDRNKPCIAQSGKRVLHNAVSVIWISVI